MSPDGPALTVVGVGTRAAADDAVGFALTERLGRVLDVRTALWQDHDALDVANAVLELGGPAVLVDCADMGMPPGSARLFRPRDARLALATSGVSTHGFGLADALQIARDLGCAWPIHVFGVQPFDVRPGRAALSAPMTARLEPLTRALVDAVRPLLPRGASCTS